ncbi:MAG: sulfatase-like hydrolase/transferase [Kiritimatiellales bacterium]
MTSMKKRIFSMMPLALPTALYSAPAEKPNVLIILMDDMGYSDISCFGGEIQTPNIDRLATNGVKFAQMYNTSKCYPTRSCLLTGVYYQRTSQDFLPNTATMGEVLRPAGYNTWWSGKNHAIFNPVNRGFDHYYGLIGGAENHFNPGSTNSPGQPVPAISVNIDGGLSWWDDLVVTADFVPQTTNFYDTDAFTDRALQWLDASNGDGKPFFLYMAYMSPHWPLHAWPEDIAKYNGVYSNGYAAVRQARYDRQVAMGLVDPVTAPLPPFDSTGLLVWENLSSADRQKEAMRMQIHAAMVDRVDQNIGRLISKLEEQGRLTNTLIIFFSDNGACAEIPTGKNVDPNAPMGSVATYEAIGPTWAQVCNTPLRKWKTDSFEGGVCTPMVVS